MVAHSGMVASLNKHNWEKNEMLSSRGKKYRVAKEMG